MALSSCSGELFFGDSDLRISDEKGTFQNGSNKENIPQISFPAKKPGKKKEEKNFLKGISVGNRCSGGRQSSYLVFSDSSVSCSAHALAIDAYLRGEEVESMVVINVDQQELSRRYCSPLLEAGCEDIDISLSLNEDRGSWSAEIEGQLRISDFEAQNCDYDGVLPPASEERPATDISIKEVAIYQGVKIPLIENGVIVTDRKAPLIAKRPGVIRVFLEPENGWKEREILARLKVGEFTKEVLFSPNIPSREMDTQSTINFQLMAGELPDEGAFSVELFETSTCSARQGKLARSSVPDVPADLGIESFAEPMKILLVPMVYNADGSGRVPNMDAAVVQRYKELALAYYPVQDIEVSVRDAIPYGGAISPNGAGFTQALNFCLSQRQNDGVDSEVYYYCLYQPAAGFGQFCGGGCVAGIAPVPPSNNIGLRGGIGIAFDGEGEDTFVHEIGHALGRPHSPCGGAAGADQGYPYNGGDIGSIGYSIFSGQLIQGNQAKDFMGYCRPTWVSDFTYSKIFDRLSQVLGRAQNQISSPPRLWRSAILDIDGELKWDVDHILRGKPQGRLIAADLIGFDGIKIASPEVFAISIADLDTTIFLIEDVLRGQKIDLAGIGTLPLGNK